MRDEQTGSIAVLLVEDHDLVLESLRVALAGHKDIEIVEVARSLAGAQAVLARLQPDIIVTDLRLGDGKGTALVAHHSRAGQPVPVLLITGTDDRSGIEEALEAGCAGFVSKGHSFDSLVAAIHAVARGATVFPASLLASVTLDGGDRVGSSLSPREREVLQLLAEAKTADEIAEILYVSVHTVRNHIRRVLTKLGVKSQLEAVVVSARHNLVRLG